RRVPFDLVEFFGHAAALREVYSAHHESVIIPRPAFEPLAPKHALLGPTGFRYSQLSPRHKTPEPSPRRVLLKRMDQAAIAGLTLAALVSIGAYWLAQGGASGRLIEIDRAPRQTVQFQ